MTLCAPNQLPEMVKLKSLHTDSFRSFHQKQVVYRFTDLVADVEWVGSGWPLNEKTLPDTERKVLWKGKERKGKERKGKERKGKERKGKEREGTERKGEEKKERK